MKWGCDGHVERVVSMWVADVGGVQIEMWFGTRLLWGCGCGADGNGGLDGSVVGKDVGLGEGGECRIMVGGWNGNVVWEEGMNWGWRACEKECRDLDGIGVVHEGWKRRREGRGMGERMGVGGEKGSLHFLYLLCYCMLGAKGRVCCRIDRLIYYRVNLYDGLTWFSIAYERRTG